MEGNFTKKANNIKHGILAVRKANIAYNAMFFFLYPILSKALRELCAMQCMANQ